MKVGLTKRHMPDEIQDFVFGDIIENPMDFAGHRIVVEDWLVTHWDTLREAERLNLYVTGLTPLLVAFLEGWVRMSNSTTPPIFGHVSLVLMHWDKEKDKYVEQKWVAPNPSHYPAKRLAIKEQQRSDETDE